MGVLELEDVAVATSGGYRHCHEVAGRMVSHTMDPRTGEPLDNGLAAVTVLAETCMAADAWATALLVRGLDEGVALARRLGMVGAVRRRAGQRHLDPCRLSRLSGRLTYAGSPAPEGAAFDVSARHRRRQ